MKVLVIDNYDSFTFNLVQMLGRKKCKIILKRNDEISLIDLKQLKPDKILISPGPGNPANAGVSIDIIKQYSDIPILGVCLGHQAIAAAFGIKIVSAQKPVHGTTSKISHDNKTIFENIPQNINVMRYHSLIVQKPDPNSEIEISASTNEGIIMGIRHKYLPIEGIQFHPESILTEFGSVMIENWLRL